MKRKGFTAQQFIWTLKKQAAGVSASDLCPEAWHWQRDILSNGGRAFGETARPGLTASPSCKRPF